MYLWDRHERLERPCVGYHVHTIFDHFKEKEDCLTPTWFVYRYHHGTHCEFWWHRGECKEWTNSCQNHAWMNMACISWRQNVCNCRNKKHAKQMCMKMQWFMRMRWMNMINDECKNYMSIMVPWRDVWCDQGNNVGWVFSMSLIQEPSGNGLKVHYPVKTSKGSFM